MASNGSKAYHPSALIQWFNNFPRYNLQLDLVNVTTQGAGLDPSQEDYLVALGVIAFAVCLFGAVIFLITSVGLCIRGCQKRSTQATADRCLKGLLVGIVIVAM